MTTVKINAVTLLGRLQNTLQDNDDSMLKSLKEDMPHNDVEKVDKLTPVIKDVIILSRNAFAMRPYDKSYLPLDEVADLLVLNDLDFKGLKRFQSIGDGNYLFRLTSLLHCGKSIFHCQTGIMDQVTGFEYLFLLIIHPANWWNCIIFLAGLT